MKLFLFSLLAVAPVLAQEPPYDVFPEAEPPYFRVRYEASDKPGELIYPVKYTVWIPPQVETLRGLIVHQHGCGEGSCKSGLTGAWDLHWQALAKKFDCALMAPSYEQPQDADCGMWCDPRNGSDAAFLRSLVDLGKMSGHPELAEVPWALWGHSGGGVWAGGMTLLHPERVAAAWLRSGVPILDGNPNERERETFSIPGAAFGIPIMCNLGTEEGYTVKEGRFSRVWPVNQDFHRSMREGAGLIGLSVDPLTGHQCGNQRYLAIPWFDACLSLRLPEEAGDPLNEIEAGDAWLAESIEGEAMPESEFSGEMKTSIWLPNEAIAKSWMQYLKDTEVGDSTPPPAPTNIATKNGVLTWDAVADLESGIERFLILRDGEQIASVPEDPKNPFGRPLFQGLQYSDTPVQPLAKMEFQVGEGDHEYLVISVNTVGLKSE